MLSVFCSACLYLLVSLRGTLISRQTINVKPAELEDGSRAYRFECGGTVWIGVIAQRLGASVRGDQALHVLDRHEETLIRVPQRETRASGRPTRGSGASG